MDKSHRIQEKVSKLLDAIDFSKPNITVMIRDSGDPSRYHETVALQYFNGEWSLSEDYLTPEHSFSRRIKLAGFSKTTAAEWLAAFMAKNDVLLDENRSCPKIGLCIPCCSDHEHRFVALTHFTHHSECHCDQCGLTVAFNRGWPERIEPKEIHRFLQKYHGSKICFDF